MVNSVGSICKPTDDVDAATAIQIEEQKVHVCDQTLPSMFQAELLVVNALLRFDILAVCMFDFGYFRHGISPFNHEWMRVPAREHQV